MEAYMSAKKVTKHVDTKSSLGLRQCTCGSRQFLNGKCAFAALPPKTSSNDLSWISPLFNGMK